jgi:hypothetical protein
VNPSRIWTLGAVVVIVAICGGAVGLGVQPSLAAAAAADASTAQVEQTDNATQIELARLAKLAASQSALQQQENRLASAVTGSLRLTTFSKQLRDAAALDNVKITSLQTSAGTAYIPPVAAPATASTPTSSSTPSPSATPSVAAAPVADPGRFGKTDPAITAANFVVIPVTVVVTGNEAASVAFAQDVQHLSRLFAVDTVTYAKAVDGSELPTTTVSGTIYALKR